MGIENYGASKPKQEQDPGLFEDAFKMTNEEFTDMMTQRDILEEEGEVNKWGDSADLIKSAEEFIKEERREVFRPEKHLEAYSETKERYENNIEVIMTKIKDGDYEDVKDKEKLLELLDEYIEKLKIHTEAGQSEIDI